MNREKKFNLQPKSLTENQEEQAIDAIFEFLIDNNIITIEEIKCVTPEKISEFILRMTLDKENFSKETNKINIEKTRRILGLNLKLGEGKIDESRRKEQIDSLIIEMKEYLNLFQKECPEILGMILCGSRMDAQKLPSAQSDVDVVLILKKGIVTDPRLKEGENLLFKLRSFSDNTKTSSGLPVELDELYSVDEFLEKLQNPDDKSKLTWGNNPKAVFYIGSGFEELSDKEINEKILSELTSYAMVTLKNQALVKAQQEIIEHLKHNQNP